MRLPYGSWASPLSAADVAAASLSFGQVEASGDAVWFEERRPSEGGRVAVVRAGHGDAVPEGWNVRTRVHEYGGGAFWVHGETLYAVRWEDQRIWRLSGGEPPVAVSPEGPYRWADGALTPDGRTILCVRETHGDGEPRNEVVALASDGSGDVRVIDGGHDFCSFPRPSPDGRRLCWTTWDHPRMPWDGTELWVADFDSGEPRLVAGGKRESVFQPAWAPDGTLCFVSDRTGWWNLYRWTGEGAEPLCPMEAEFGMPQWVFGMSTYDFLADGAIACRWSHGGIDHLGVLRDGELATLDVPYTSITGVRCAGDRIVFVGSAPALPASVVAADPRTGAVEVLRRSAEEDPDPGYVSMPETLTFPTEGGLEAHALFYRPRNPECEAPEEERPPLLVLSHGGPTSHRTPADNPGVRFWTSRGFAVVDVNYGGSTGYGRAYRERLLGRWGVVDVDDCVNAARFLAERGDVDAERLAIRGGSAGGYTTLCALAFRPGVFRAGGNHYGVADLELLARDTHKFESRYLDSLVGPYPERRDLYEARSPLRHADAIRTPLITFQGLEDAVVPPAQSEAIVDALRRNGVPVAYVAFPGEQHGFRRAETIVRALEAELSFYGQVLGFEPAGDIEPVEIENL